MFRYSMYKLILSASVIASMIFGAGIALGSNHTNSSGGEVNLVANYYANANSITNGYFNKVLNFFNELDLDEPDYLQEIKTQLLPPENLASRDFSACRLSISSVCLQIELENLYAATEPRLIQIQNSFAENNTRSNSFSSFTSLNDVRREFIDEQLNYMRSINLQALEFYRQLLFAYPVHIQNQQTKESLKEFVGNLKQMEQNFKPYPGVFHNVSTPQCI